MKMAVDMPPAKSTVFEKTYIEYLAQVAGVDFRSKQELLGIKVEGDEVVIPFFGKPHRVSASGIIDTYGKRPDFSTCVVLCKYLLLCPETHPKGCDWVSYRDFKDTPPLVDYFVNNVEKPIAVTFSGRLDELKKACEKLGSIHPGIELSYDLSMRFDPLPRVPVLMLFNDADDEFPPQCSVLFEKRAKNYLDGECLAVLGTLLSTNLKSVLGCYFDTEATLYRTSSA